MVTRSRGFAGCSPTAEMVGSIAKISPQKTPIDSLSEILSILKAAFNNLPSSPRAETLVQRGRRGNVSLLARTGPPARSAIRSLSGEDRTWRRQPNSVEIDPHRKSRNLGLLSL